MRFTLSFLIQTPALPVNYRPIFISFLKRSLTDYQDGQLYQTYYKDVMEKPFTIAIHLGSCTFESEQIQLHSNQVNLHFSTSSIEAGINFYNAFMHQKETAFPLPDYNQMVLKKINVDKEFIITGNTVICDFIAPLCIRKHNRETNKDQYITFQDANFETELKLILSHQFRHIPEITEQMVSDFIIIPYRSKTVMVKHYEHCMPCSIGEFILKGNPLLLTYLYQSGMASRKSSGFGFIQILTQGGDS